MVKCYLRRDKNPNVIKSMPSGVCIGSGSSGGFFSCCSLEDECLPGGLCFSNTSLTYATALCTDQTLRDEVCQKGCGGRYRTGLTYNSTDGLWACCDKDDDSCSTKTNETMKSPSPDALKGHTMPIANFIPTDTAASRVSISTSSSSSSSSSSSLSLSSSSGLLTRSLSSDSPSSAQRDQSSSSSSSSSSPSSGLGTSSLSSDSPSSTQRGQSSPLSLSSGATAGIGIGIVLVLIAIVTSMALWFLKKRMQTRTESQGFYEKDGAPPYHGIVVEKYGQNIVEAPTSHGYQPWEKGRTRADQTKVYELT